MLEIWNNIYSYITPVAFTVINYSVHWYGLLYAVAILIALLFAKYLTKKDLRFKPCSILLDTYFIYVEVGIILGARLAYVFIYSTTPLYYLINPIKIFSPYDAYGNLVGISGMSYHGAVIGYILATYIFVKIKKEKLSLWTDLAAISIPLGYIFGRLGNFVNHGLIGRVTDVSWGVFVNDKLRHPSQIYEALTEGLLTFIIIYMLRNVKYLQGKLIILYAFLYSISRFITEFYREPDPQIGLINGVTMGQILSVIMAIVAVITLFVINPNKKRC